MKVATLNLGHQARRPRTVPAALLDSLVALEADVLFLTEYVATDDYEAALASRWKGVASSAQVVCGPGRCHNQVVALSRGLLRVRDGHVAIPTEDARTNFISVEMEGWTLTGLRAPSYESTSEWYGYWDSLTSRLDGDVVIGDFNVDRSRRRKWDRVLPSGWQIVTPPGLSYRSFRNSAESTLDHALVRPGVDVVSAEYRPEFFGQWGLDHCPLVVEVAR